MSAAGPHSTTRLILSGHRQFMKRDGSGCWAGVRRLAIVCGVNKSTVAKHRALAIAAGWLIVSVRSPSSRCRMYLAAIPDAVPIPQTRRTQKSAKVGRLSELTGQSSSPRLSAFRASTVRPGRTHCPTPPDTTLVLTNNRTLAQRDARQATATATSSTSGGARADHPLSAAELLGRWLQTDGTAERFRGCHQLLINCSSTSLRPRSVSRGTRRSYEGHRIDNNGNRQEIASKRVRLVVADVILRSNETVNLRSAPRSHKSASAAAQIVHARCCRRAQGQAW